MDNRKAIEALKEMDGVIRNDHQMEAVRLAIEALEKQIPARPDMFENTARYYACFDCGIDVDPKDKYCRNCGQKIDWEVE